MTAVAIASGWWLGGPAVAAGVLGGSAVALLNFLWLARDVSRAAALAAGGTVGAGRIAGLGFRQIASFAAIGTLVASGWAHPAGVALGLAVLPPVLFAQGFRAGREPD